MTDMCKRDDAVAHGDVETATQVLLNGGVVIYPTETVWGVGCDARNSEAVRRVCSLKGRDYSKGLIVIVADEAMLRRMVGEVPDAAMKLMRRCGELGRAVTVVYEGVRDVADEVRAQDGSVAIRVAAAGSVARALSAGIDAGIVSTSANVQGEPAPKTADEISATLLRGADYTLKGESSESTGRRQEGSGVPSMVVRIGAGGEIVVLRS